MLLSLLNRDGKQQTSIGGYLSLTLARICWAGNRGEEADAHLTHALDLAQNWQYLALLAECFESRALFALDRGELDAAEQALQTVRQLIQEGGIAIRLPQVESAQIQLWLARGNFAAAEAWTVQTHFEQNGLADASSWEITLTLARIQLAQHVYAAARPVLERLLRSAEQGECLERVAQTLALQVVALDGLKERKQARQIAVRLLQITQPAGLMRVFLNAGEPMRRTLQHLRTTRATESACAGEIEAHLTLLLEAFAQEERQRLVPASLLVRPREASLSPDAAPAHPGLHEPLSSQEQRVLRLLVAGHTYAEIARELIVSPNTIKTQVSSIYRKLGVNRRAEASLVAQQLHLL
jgi:LuxR family maltose regulon positive regulatory protein